MIDLRLRSWMRGAVAVCGLALAALAVAVQGPAGAQEKDAATLAAELAGTWQYVEDRTPPEQKRDPRERPPLGPSFKVALDEKTVVVEQTRRGAIVAYRLALDGSEHTEKAESSTRTTSGKFEGGALTITDRRSSERDGKLTSMTTEFTLTPAKDGLIVRMRFSEPSNLERFALYRNAKDIPALTPAKGTLGALAWLDGRFVTAPAGASKDGSKQPEMEEHWGPASGGSMLGTARTVSGGKMKSFEFLRIEERDGGLVYIAQPGGGPATEFVLTELTETRAVFENAVHDYPKRVVYEHLPASKDGKDGLRTEISDTGGARAFSVSYVRAR